jgi:hypothetical protein
LCGTAYRRKARWTARGGGVAARKVIIAACLYYVLDRLMIFRWECERLSEYVADNWGESHPFQLLVGFVIGDSQYTEPISAEPQPND